MTSAIPLDDVKAALVHMQDTLPKLKGQRKTEAQAVIASILALIARLGG